MKLRSYRVGAISKTTTANMAEHKYLRNSIKGQGPVKQMPERRIPVVGEILRHKI